MYSSIQQTKIEFAENDSVVFIYSKNIFEYKKFVIQHKFR